MRRLDIINSVNKVRHAIIDSQIHDALGGAFSTKEFNPEAIMTSFQRFSNHTANFGANERKILEIFGLEGIENPKLWTKILTGERVDARDVARPYYRGMSFMLDYLGDITTMLKQDHLEYSKENNHVVVNPQNKGSQDVMTVILPENELYSSNPQRLVKILESISSFYEVISKLENHAENDLSVVAIDSGSDKSFDFLGAAKVVTAVKELIIDLWDKIVFFKERKLTERIDLVGKSLSIIERINLSEQNGQIGQEQAEILRRGIFSGTKGFIECGALLPEFEAHASYNPRQLMAAEPKLLTMPENIGIERARAESASNAENDDVAASGETKVSIEDLDSEQREELLKQLLADEQKKKARRKSKG